MGHAKNEKTEAMRKCVHQEEVVGKKLARQVKLANCRPILTLGHLKFSTPGLTVAVIDEQLDWHCEWVDRGAKGEKQIPIKKLLPNKRSMLWELRSVVRRYKANLNLWTQARELLEVAGVVWAESVYEAIDDEPGEEDTEEDEREDVGAAT